MTETKTKSRLQDEFNALPLEDKFANLFRMEATTIGEALKFVAESSMKAVEKAGAAIQDLSAKIETEVKKASADCKAEGNGEQAGTKKAAGATKRSRPATKKKPA